MALFGEKYGDVVRVVDVPGVSLELCGGTHVRSTGEIGIFRFTHETGAAAGVRRIEAITGPAAYRTARALERRLQEAAGLLKAQPEHLTRRLETLLEEHRRLEKQVAELIKKASRGSLDDTVKLSLPRGATLLVQRTQLADRKQIGTILDAIRESQKNTVAVVLSATPSNPSVHIGVTDDLINSGFTAPAIASTISASTGGKGGGRPHFASGSIGDPTRIPTDQDLLSLVSSCLSGKK
jgi:alanyl-tRNA synthetase